MDEEIIAERDRVKTFWNDFGEEILCQLDMDIPICVYRMDSVEDGIVLRQVRYKELGNDKIHTKWLRKPLKESRDPLCECVWKFRPVAIMPRESCPHDLKKAAYMDNTKLKSRMSGKVQELQQPSVATAPDTSLAPVDTGYLALNNNALDIIRANLKSQPLTLDLFDLVKSPSGGSTVFSVPGLTGDEPAKVLTGIILDYTTPRAYWDTPDPVEGTPPVCMSRNSIISYDGKACAHCPYNDFGSKDGESNAKACKESVLLFLLRPDSIVPLLVRVPVTSKARFLKYSTRLLSTLTPISSVVTKITLEKATSKQGKPYALFNFEAVGTLSPEEADHAKAYVRQFMEIVNAAELVPELAEAS